MQLSKAWQQHIIYKYKLEALLSDLSQSTWESKSNSRWINYFDVIVSLLYQNGFE